MIAAACLVVGFGAAACVDPNMLTPMPPDAQPPEATTEAGPAPAAGPLFEVMDSAITGIDFANMLPITYTGPYIYMGAGVATGDVDGDGLVDIYLVSQMGDGRLYRNLGDWQFEDITAQSGIEVSVAPEAQFPRRFPNGAHFVDVDNDGDLDLFLTALGGSTRLWINDGTGRFTDGTLEAGLEVIGGSTTVAVADYDRDGHVDIFVTTYRPFGLTLQYPNLQAGHFDRNLHYDVENDKLLPERDRLFRNLGDGTFADVSEAAGITERGWGLSAEWGDLDGDGWLDLYVANDFETPDRVYMNQGDGTFAPMAPDNYRHSAMFSMGINFGDFNNDGRMDLMTSDMMSPDPIMHLTQVGGMAVMPMGEDLMEPVPQIMRNVLFMNRGGGVLSDVANMAGVPATGWTWTPKLVDADLDGYLDLLVTNGFIRDDMDADRATHLRRLGEEGRYAEAVQYALDAPALTTPNMAFRNEDGLRFTDVSAEWGFNVEAMSNGAAFADLDNDGDLDVVINNFNGFATILQNRAAANRVKVGLRGSESNSYGIGALVSAEAGGMTQTRMMTTGGGFLSSHEPVVVFGLAEATVIDQLTVVWPSGRSQILTDVDANQTLVLDEADASGNGIGAPAAMSAPVVRFMARELEVMHRPYTGDNFMQNLRPWSLSRFGPGVAWGDFDGDGWDDLVVAGGAGQGATLLRSAAGADFESVPIDRFPPPLGVFEMSPLVWHPGGGEPAQVLVSRSRRGSDASAVQRIDPEGGAAAVAAPRSIPSDAGAMAAADIDGDGDLDLFVAGRLDHASWPGNVSSAIYMNVEGQLEPVEMPALAEIGLVTGAVWTDVDGDGDPDLVLATEWGSLRLLLNEAGVLTDATAASGLSDYVGLWQGVTAADVNNDGHMDIVATNFGLNSQYGRNPAPIVVAGDFGGDGITDSIEAREVDGTLFPMRPWSEVAMVAPGVDERFSTFLEFAQSPLADILGSDVLATAQVVRANWLAHTVFLGDGMGGFEAVPLPDLAQIQPGFGVVAADFDNDGHVDILLVGNFRHVDMHHGGLHDAGLGLLLAGDGTGNFTPVDWQESGIFIVSDARGAAVADFDRDGWPDVAVASDGGSVVLLENAGGTNDWIAVRLVGPAGNPTGVGARVSVERADGLVMHREVSAGGGYMSQDSARLTFGLASAGDPVRILVRWPDGSETVVEDAPAGDEVEIRIRR